MTSKSDLLKAIAHEVALLNSNEHKQVSAENHMADWVEKNKSTLIMAGLGALVLSPVLFKAKKGRFVFKLVSKVAALSLVPYFKKQLFSSLLKKIHH